MQAKRFKGGKTKLMKQGQKSK